MFSIIVIRIVIDRTIVPTIGRHLCAAREQVLIMPERLSWFEYGIKLVYSGVQPLDKHYLTAPATTPFMIHFWQKI